ncbi:hypothetical protein EAI_14567 [Harpegnathos saltator]|uniref:Uncharacterized protein n=1 Tax=Harpegnathos saltator TaxID=610380 RepID=E2C743_HARSA|nr:hypothetical protein EAI_14567 [Harpegnathos saltator]
MVLSSVLSNSSLPLCLRHLVRLTSTADFVRSRFLRTLPPTILTEVLGRKDKGKSFGKDATAGSDLQGVHNFM